MASPSEVGNEKKQDKTPLPKQLSSDDKSSVEHLKKKRKHSHDFQLSKHERMEKEKHSEDHWNITSVSTFKNGSRSPSPNKHSNGLKTKLTKIKVEGESSILTYYIFTFTNLYIFSRSVSGFVSLNPSTYDMYSCRLFSISFF